MRASSPICLYAFRGGGGGGSFGVVTRLVLRTRPLPQSFGGVFGAVAASSDAAYRALIAKAIAFYRERLFKPHWGEQIGFRRNNVLELALVFQGLGARPRRRLSGRRSSIGYEPTTGLASPAS